MYQNNLKDKKISFMTLGCKVNSYESDAMSGQLKARGAEIVPFGNKADVIIINTCSVTNTADKKSRQMLHRARTRNPNAVIVATGCYVQVNGDELIKDGTADIVIGNNNKSEAGEIINEYLNKNSAECMRVGDIATDKRYDELRVNESLEHTRAFIKIQDGCNQFCTYCIIPYARGRVRSRNVEDIIEEIKGLAENGYREVVLTGIHLSSYGLDNYEAEAGTPEFEHAPLLNVIKQVAELEGIDRIRLGSLEPRIMTKEFTQELSKITKLCPQFHLSLQSGCNSVLKRMNRHYTAEEFYESCNTIREFFERPAITTDVISGFPGETEEEFEENLKLLEKVQFAKLHVFAYSRRKGTVADRLPNQISEQTKHLRSEKMLALDHEMREKYIASFIDSEDEVLFERLVEIDGKKYLLGIDSRYVELAIPAEDRDKDKVNTLMKVRILSILKDDIMLCERLEQS